MIVGQGLAGTVLALTLMEEGKSIVIIGDESLSACSMATGGNINPVVLKRLVKSWKADDLVPAAFAFYRRSEKLLGQRFFRPMPLLKVLSGREEAEFWTKRAPECDYIDTIMSPKYPDLLTPHQATAVVSNTANVNVPVFLKAAREYLVSRECFIAERFDHGSLSLSEGVSYRWHSAHRIVFCEGWKALENPLFSYLPFSPVKGETLTVRIAGVPFTDEMIHHGVGMVPLGDGLYKVGATFAWDDLNDKPTAEAFTELETKLRELLCVPFEVVSQQAGVRPAVKDRRPLIGWHPEFPNAGIFNGLGTKGVMLAPYFAKRFLDATEKGVPMETEAAIERFPAKAQAS